MLLTKAHVFVCLLTLGKHLLTNFLISTVAYIAEYTIHCIVEFNIDLVTTMDLRFQSRCLN